jgi:hypothetical protein
MPEKAELKRRRAQSQRDKARSRQEEEAAAVAETKRRQAQSQRDKARNRREEEERIGRVTRAIQRQLPLDCRPSLPPAVPEAHSPTISPVAIMEARSAKLMQDIARDAPFRLTQLYLTCIACLITRAIPMLWLSSTVKNYLSTDPSSAHKANTLKKHFRRYLLREAQGCSHSTMIVEPPTGGCLSTCTLVTIRTIFRIISKVRQKLSLCARHPNDYQMTPRCLKSLV